MHTPAKQVRAVLIRLATLYSAVDCRTGLPMQGGGYGHGVVTAAKAFLESGYAEIGTGTLNEALALRRSGVTAPVHLCYQPDIQSARAVAHAHDVQAGSCL